MTVAGNGSILEVGPDGLRGKDFGVAADPAHWDQQWASDDARIGASFGPSLQGHLPYHLRATVARRLAPPARVVEAGCGPAHFTVARRVRGYRAVAVDWGDRTTASVRHRFPGVPVLRSDVRSSAFAGGSVDGVYSPGVCEHFESGPDEVLLDARRMLRPGGYLFVSTPHLHPLRRHRTRRGGPQAFADGAGTDRRGAFYQYRFTIDGMTATLQRLGFEVLEAWPYGAVAGLGEAWPKLGVIPAVPAVGALDLVPGIRQFGFSVLWTARKPSAP